MLLFQSIWIWGSLDLDGCKWSPLASSPGWSQTFTCFLWKVNVPCSIWGVMFPAPSGSLSVAFTVWSSAVPAFTLERHWLDEPLPKHWSTSISYKGWFILKPSWSWEVSRTQFHSAFLRAGFAPEWFLQCWCLRTLCFLFSPPGSSQPLNPPLPFRSCNYYFFFHDALLNAFYLDQKELHSPVLRWCNPVKASTKHFIFGHDFQRMNLTNVSDALTLFLTITKRLYLKKSWPFYLFHSLLFVWCLYSFPITQKAQRMSINLGALVHESRRMKPTFPWLHLAVGFADPWTSFASSPSGWHLWEWMEPLSRFAMKLGLEIHVPLRTNNLSFYDIIRSWNKLRSPHSETWHSPQLPTRFGWICAS